MVLLLEPKSDGRDHVLAELDRRIADLSTSRAALLHDIAKLTPGYSVALEWAVKNMGFDKAIGTVRYNKRRGGCYTFGMPSQPVMGVWVDVASGAVVRCGPIDW